MAEPAPTYICVECGTRGEPLKPGASARVAAVLLFISGVLVLLWGLSSPLLIGATLIVLGLAFVFAALIVDAAVVASQHLTCRSCFSPRIIPVTSPVGRRVVAALESPAEARPSAAPQAPA